MGLFSALMKKGSIIAPHVAWSMDSPRLDFSGFLWNQRTAYKEESFLVLSDPKWISNSYMGIFVQGSMGIEIIAMCVHNQTAFSQGLECAFREVK